jgi:hypothetical protein
MVARFAEADSQNQHASVTGNVKDDAPTFDGQKDLHFHLIKGEREFFGICLITRTGKFINAALMLTLVFTLYAIKINNLFLDIITLCTALISKKSIRACKIIIVLKLDIVDQHANLIHEA